MAKKITPLVPRPARNLLSAREAAAYLGISRGALYSWVSMKRVAYVKAGDRTMFLQADLDDFIDRHRVAAANNGR
jgi:excisionase family DNA binding protein